MGVSKIFKYWFLSRMFPEKKGNHYLKKYMSVIEKEYRTLKKAEDKKNGIFDYEEAFQKYQQSEHQDTSPKILFDIETTRSFKGSLTGVQRVVWSVLHILMRKGVPGYKVYPVYMTEYGVIKANRFINEIFSSKIEIDDEYFEVTSNDIFVSIDINLNFGSNFIYSNHLSNLRRRGVKTYFLIHDLIPLNFPQYVSSNLTKLFEKYIIFVSCNNDGIITNSKASADEYRKWLKINMPEMVETSTITWTHLGHDLQQYSFSKGIPDSSEYVFSAMGERETCLMVSTVEPRKGYRQSLAAFELLWSRGRNCNLVIVGKPGWMMDDFFDYLKNHPENGKKLFWLSGISDEYLHEIYQRTSGVLMASEAEGFGLSIIECAGHGKPLLCRNLPVFEEIAGEYATYFSDDKPEPFADAIATWFDLISKGQTSDTSKIRALTWAEMTENILGVILPKVG